jgi:hypothetical protein
MPTNEKTREDPLNHIGLTNDQLADLGLEARKALTELLSTLGHRGIGWHAISLCRCHAKARRRKEDKEEKRRMIGPQGQRGPVSIAFFP